MKNLIKALVLSAPALALIACSGGSTSYSMLATGQSFKQATVNSKVDLLWVIDNSLSMIPLQQNLTNNFGYFMSDFVGKGYDYRLAVTTSDAYLANADYRNNPSLARWRDGVNSTHTGVFVVTPAILNPINIFVTNASQGASGSGDERGFQSYREALSSLLNSDFLRPDSFFGMIILSDEDDFSNPNRPEGDFTYGDHNYSDPGIETVASQVAYLDGLTHSTGSHRRYSVSAITVLDSACQSSHAAQSGSTIIGTRYIQLANMTNGVLGSVCDSSFASSLAAIQQKILELSTAFPLDGSPDPATIQVFVNGVSIAQGSTNGWTYDSTTNAISFHGASVPPAGAAISVKFDPSHLTF